MQVRTDRLTISLTCRTPPRLRSDRLECVSLVEPLATPEGGKGLALLGLCTVL
jgi:hypothetical protein